MADNNHGVETNGGIRTGYGKDSSEMTFKKNEERIPSSLGGSTENLSHTLSGGSANQRQK